MYIFFIYGILFKKPHYYWCSVSMWYFIIFYLFLNIFFSLHGISLFGDTIPSFKKDKPSILSLLPDGELKQEKNEFVGKPKDTQTGFARWHKNRSSQKEEDVKVVAKEEGKLEQPDTKTLDQLLKKTVRDMNEEELVRARVHAKQKEETDLVIKYDERLLIISANQELLREVRLELADLYFDKGNMKYAYKLYQEYNQLYPGNKQEYQYAKYRAIVSKFHVRLQPNHDQTKTRKTLALADIFLHEQKDSKAQYIKEIEDIRTTCLNDLFEHERDIFQQYLTRQRLAAAKKRLEIIKDEFLARDKAFEPKVLELEFILAQKHNDDTQAKTIMGRLQMDFPNYSSPVVVANSKRSFFDRS